MIGSFTGPRSWNEKFPYTGRIVECEYLAEAVSALRQVGGALRGDPAASRIRNDS